VAVSSAARGSAAPGASSKPTPKPKPKAHAQAPEAPAAPVEQGTPSERAEVLRKTAQAQREAKDEAGARASLDQALAILPDYAPALQELIQLQIAQGRSEEALASVERLAKALEKASLSERVDVFRQKAHLQDMLKDGAGARASLESALALAPDDVPALQALVQIQLSQNKPQDALATVERLDRATEKAMETAAALARADVLRKKARAQRDLKDASGARKSLERALKLAPEQPDALRDLVEVELDGGQPKKALAVVERLAKASEYSPPAERVAVFLQQARIERDLKNEAATRASLDRALELMPAFAPALDELARLQASQGKSREALATLERLARASAAAAPVARADVLRRMAQLQSEFKDAAGARQNLEQALALAPGDLGTLWLLVDGRRAQPQEALDLVDGHRPSDAGQQVPWLVMRGLAHAMLKDDAASRDDFSAAIKLDAAAACFNDLFSRQRDRLDVAYFDLCVQNFPKEPALYVDRGVMRYLSGQKEEAVADFRKAVELKPSDTEASLSLASALSGQGNAAEALAAADRAVELAKDKKSPAYSQLVALRGSLLEAVRAAKPEIRP
jgi:tetratricopeptide (TPR) repeat protein